MAFAICGSYCRCFSCLPSTSLSFPGFRPLFGPTLTHCPLDKPGRMPPSRADRLRPQMPDDPKRKAASKAVKAAQKQFERDSKAAREARRKAFARAQKDGLSLREIGELVDLDHSRVGQIIRGE